MTTNHQNHRSILKSIAHRAMLERGLLPDFSTEALAELGKLQQPTLSDRGPIRDMRNLLWASIDNDDSRDLDQLTVAEAVPPDKVRVFVAIADVDASIKKGSAIDDHAHHNPPRSTPLPRYFRCCQKKFRPTLHLLISTRTAFPLWLRC
jgi:exoribonuclease R